MRTTTFLSVLGAITTRTAAILIQDVTQEEFATFVKENDLSLIAFSSRTFEAVQPFHAIFSQAAETVDTPFAIINCDTETELCKQYDINSYPTIRLFKRNKIKNSIEGETQQDTEQKEEEEEFETIRYRGRRTKRALKSFVTKHQVPPLSNVLPADLQSFKNIDDLVLIAYLRPDQTALLETFRSVAENHHQEYVFGYSVDMGAADAEGLAMPSVVCYKNTDGDNRVMSGHFGAQEVENFLEGAKGNLIKEFKEKDIDAFMVRDKLTVYLFATTEDEALVLRHELTPVAKRYEKFAIVAVADAVEFSPMAKSFGLAVEKFPALAIHAPMNDNAFTYQQGRKISASIVDAMLTKILQGKAVNGQVFGGEAPEMEGQDEGPEHNEL